MPSPGQACGEATSQILLLWGKARLLQVDLSQGVCVPFQRHFRRLHYMIFK